MIYTEQTSTDLQMHALTKLTYSIDLSLLDMNKTYIFF